MRLIDAYALKAVMEEKLQLDVIGATEWNVVDIAIDNAPTIINPIGSKDGWNTIDTNDGIVLPQLGEPVLVRYTDGAYGVTSLKSFTTDYGVVFEWETDGANMTDGRYFWDAIAWAAIPEGPDGPFLEGE